MVEIRERLTQALLADSVIKEVFGDRVLQMGAVADNDGSPPEKPYLTVKRSLLSPAAELGGTDFANTPKRNYWQFWAHDVIGDFRRIDRGLDAVERVLLSLTSEGTFMCFHFVEASQDFNDDELGDATRFIRMQEVTSGTRRNNA